MTTSLAADARAFGDHTYSYANCLRAAITRSWTVEDCFRGRAFDFNKRFVPDAIAGVETIGCLSDGEKRMLNQIRGNSYCHLFGFVEEYIVPQVMDHGRADVYGDATRLWALLRFAEEEVKHQELMRRAVEQFDEGFGTHCGLIEGRDAVAEVVLSASPLAAMLLTTMIEWFTQLHYVEHVQEHAELDELFRDLLRFHWIDESRHAQMDTLLVAEIAAPLPIGARDSAIDELLGLGAAVDGLLASQIELDLEALETASGRTFSDAEREEIRTAQRRSYRWTFIVSGLRHPNFVKLVEGLTSDGAAKLDAAARALSA
jgi:hypothetical protein